MEKPLCCSHATPSRLNSTVCEALRPLEVRGSGTRAMRVPNFTYPSALTKAATPHLLQTSCTGQERPGRPMGLLGFNAS